jgi:hypothetical protein
MLAGLGANFSIFHADDDITSTAYVCLKAMRVKRHRDGWGLIVLKVIENRGEY